MAHRLVYYSDKLCGTLVTNGVIYTNGSPSPLIVQEDRPHRALLPAAGSLLVLLYSLYIAYEVHARSLAEAFFVLMGGAVAASITFVFLTGLAAWAATRGVMEAVRTAAGFCRGQLKPPKGMVIVCTEEPPREVVEATCGPGMGEEPGA